MSKRGLFKAVIKLLKEKTLLQEYDDFETGIIYRIELEQAIRILEAAGKMDKKEALSHMKKRMTDGAEDCRICNQIRALLESLPDPEEERK